MDQNEGDEGDEDDEGDEHAESNETDGQYMSRLYIYKWNEMYHYVLLNLTAE